MRILKSEQGPLWVALALSIFVHLLILPSLKILKWHKAAPVVMTAILQPLPPANKNPQVQARLSPHAVTPKPLQQRAASKREAAQKKHATVKSPATARTGHVRAEKTLLSRSDASSSPTPPSATPSIPKNAGEKDRPATAASAAAETENDHDQTEQNRKKKSPDTDAPHAEHVLPGRVRINYRLLAKGYVAHAKQEWTVTDGHYHIALQGRLRLLFFTLGAMTMSSDGRLAHGIPEPDRYVEDRNGRVATATFMEAGDIAIDQAGHSRTVKPDARPVDLMSLAYVLAAQPSIATGSVFTLVNRNEVEDLRLDTIGGGQITIAGQTFAVQRYVLNRLKSAGGVEIWLAPQLDEVPVSVIIRGRDGELTMTAERIGINEP